MKYLHCTKLSLTKKSGVVVYNNNVFHCLCTMFTFIVRAIIGPTGKQSSRVNCIHAHGITESVSSVQNVLIKYIFTVQKLIKLIGKACYWSEYEIGKNKCKCECDVSSFFSTSPALICRDSGSLNSNVRFQWTPKFEHEIHCSHWFFSFIFFDRFIFKKT